MCLDNFQVHLGIDFHLRLEVLQRTCLRMQAQMGGNAASKQPVTLRF